MVSTNADTILARMPLEISPTLRRFSQQAALDHPDNVPIQAMSAVVEREGDREKIEHQERMEWWSWLNSTIGPVDDEDVWVTREHYRQELINSWRIVSAEFPKMKDVPPGSTWVPTIASLRDMVSQAQDTRETKKSGGVAALKERLRNFVQALDDYKDLFAVIPKGDKYISLCTGVVSFFAKAALNYQKISDSFSTALSEVANGLKNFHSKHVQPFVDSVQNAIQQIRDEVTLITSKTTQSIQERTQSIEEKAKSIQDTAELIRDILLENAMSQRTFGRQIRHDDAYASQGKLSQMIDVLGRSGAHAMKAIEQQVTYDKDIEAVLQTLYSVKPLHAQAVPVEDALLEHPQIAGQGVADDDNALDTEETVEHLMHRSDLEQHVHSTLSRYLEDGRTEIAHNAEDSLSALLPSEVVIGLQSWLSELRSSMVWVAGKDDLTPFGAGLSVAALRICDVSKEIGIPCISFFCKQRYSFASDPSLDDGDDDDDDDKESSPSLDYQEAGLIALLYTVIVQLIYLLPDDPFPASPMLDKSSFERLDGTMASCPTALAIIRELAGYAPPSLIWVLDNVQLTEGYTTMPHLEAFVEFLREQERKTNAVHDERDKPYSKVCFTTDGNSELLNKTIEDTERVDASRMVQRRPGRPLMGGADVGELSWMGC